jgi:hypothetical protein
VVADLHGATSQKTAFFIVTAVKTSNPKFVIYTPSLNILCRKVMIVILGVCKIQRGNNCFQNMEINLQRHGMCGSGRVSLLQAGCVLTVEAG